jgi:MFS family permease
MSALGSGLATIAAPLFVAAHTRNPLIVSATAGVAWLPWLLFALPGGVLVDRVDRRRLMVTIDWTRVVAMGVLATALLAGWSSIVLLDVVLFVINTGEVIFRSASQAMIPAVVPRARLERANGWLVGGTTLMQGMIAGPLAGFLFVLAACVPERTGPRARRPTAMRTHGRRAGSARSWPRDSAGWPASGCCAR